MLRRFCDTVVFSRRGGHCTAMPLLLLASAAAPAQGTGPAYPRICVPLPVCLVCVAWTRHVTFPPATPASACPLASAMHSPAGGGKEGTGSPSNKLE